VRRILSSSAPIGVPPKAYAPPELTSGSLFEMA
jgi:hypothetical protein